MKHLLLSILFVIPAGTMVGAQQTVVPTEESVRELIAITGLRAQLNGALRQVHEMVERGTRSMSQGRPASDQAQSIIDTMKQKSADLIAEEFSWEEMEPLYLAAYRELFTQNEIDDMLVFYRSPSGRAMVEKLPRITQITSAAIQKRMGQVMQQLQKIQNDAQIELNTLAWRPSQ